MIRKRVAGMVLAGALVFSGATVQAADIFGCPGGLPEGTIWPWVTVQYQDMTEKWDGVNGEMKDIEEGPGLTEKTLTRYDFRFGYGVTPRFDVGVEVKAAAVDVQKRDKKDVEVSFHENALTEVWAAGKYFVVDRRFEDAVLEELKVSLGAGYGAGMVDDVEKLVAGLGPGCDKAQAGVLVHANLLDGALEFGGHLVYEWRGEAPEENERVDGFGFGRAGEDVPDVVQYLTMVALPVSSYVGLNFGLCGWMGAERDECLPYHGEAEYGYRHQILAALRFFPLTDDYEKRKIMLQVAVPYAVKAVTAPDVSAKLFGMWTF